MLQTINMDQKNDSYEENKDYKILIILFSSKGLKCKQHEDD